jgi:biopolymer transport protein ExbD
MGMYTSQDDGDDGWMAEINTTPLVDVMLVLLIIFLLTIPVVSATVALNLPIESAQRRDTSGDYVVISVDRVGNLYFNESFAPDLQALSSMISQ